ncbi:MAG: bifunctional (p)ppGpp synthetase/guanosine-3',5'-bis(diphosphate) 3'-pyrophosphohydrolase, partial [Trueperaceae bacterium]
MEGLLASLASSTSYLPQAEQARVTAAFELAERAHSGMRRRSGEPYIMHPVAVTVLLAEMRLDADALIAGLLHDTVEDTDVTFDQLEEEFGAAVRRIVEGETKISKLAVRVYADEQSENLRQMLLAMIGDVRIILVKLADRLHNMRTLTSLAPEKQQRISRETLEIFAPLAHRLGINHIKNELEDLSFSYLEPDRYRQLQRQVRMRHAEREAYVQQSIALLDKRMQSDGLCFELGGRSKHLYSIHRKMQRDGKNLDQIFDLMAIRAIIEPQNGADLSREDQEKAVCYRTLGIVHSLWTPIPGRFKDYVAVPKHNGYQSLHTTVIGLLGQPIEVQIRTKRMHEVAEFGVAAHWAYKQGLEDTDEIQKRLAWMQQLLDVDDTTETADAFVDAVKSDLLSERVLVFTPAGDVLNLPRGSTPIDFAYQVHTEVGHRCIGARVNGEIVPLSYRLQTGDRVEILTNRSSHYGPSPDWLKLAVTRSAKQKIRHHFRQQERQGQLEVGRRALERALKRRQLPLGSYATRAKLEQAASQLLNGDSADDIYLALAARRLPAKQILEVLAPDQMPKQQQEPARPSEPGKSISGVLVEGLDSPAKLAQCCSPVRGDDVIGYITRGRGVTVHRVDCPNVKHLMHQQGERFINVAWDAPSGEVFPVDFEVIGVDRPGLLKDVLDVIAAMNKSATRVAADVQDMTSARIHFRVDVKDQSEIDFIKTNVQRIA